MNAVHVGEVAIERARRSGGPVDADRARAQVASQMRQRVGRSARHETGCEQGVDGATDIADDLAHRFLRMRGEPVGDLGLGLQCAHHVPEEGVDPVLVEIAGARDERLEGFGVADRPGSALCAELIDEGEGGGELGVIDEGGRIRIGRGGEHEGLTAGPPGRDPRPREPHAQEEEPGEALAMMTIGLLGVRHDAHARRRLSRRPLGDERGEAAQGHRLARRIDRAGERRGGEDGEGVEVKALGGAPLLVAPSLLGALATPLPGRIASAAPPSAPGRCGVDHRFGDRPANGLAHGRVGGLGEPVLEVDEVGARSELLPGGVDDAEGHEEVGGQSGARVREVRLAELDAAQDPHRIGEGPGEGRPLGRPVDRGGGCSGGRRGRGRRRPGGY